MYGFLLFCRIYCILSQQVNRSLLSILTHDQGGARGKLYSFTLQQSLQLLQQKWNSMGSAHSPLSGAQLPHCF